MIYTINMSPSIDFFVQSKNNFNANGLTRYQTSYLLAGGKGINASTFLKRIGQKTTSLTFLKGIFGNLIKEQLQKEQVNFINFGIHIPTKLNFKFSNNQQNFEINGPKTIIDPSTKQDLLNYIKAHISSTDVVLIMGTSDFDFVRQIVQLLNVRNITFALDIDDLQIPSILQYKPLVIKPNKYELGKLFKEKIESPKKLIELGQKLLAKGPKYIIVSDGKEGAYLFFKNKVFKSHIPKINVVSASGSGDSMISAFVAKILENKSETKAFKYANACGMATAANVWVGALDDVNKYLKDVKIEQII